MTFFNRVKFLATAGGLTDFTVSTNASGYRTPADASVPDGTLVSYVAQSADLLEWEDGHGTYTAGVISRDTVLDSTNANAKVNFTDPPNVWFDCLAQDIVAWDNTNKIINLDAVTGISEVSAGVVAVGNGTQGDYSGKLVAGVIGIGTNAPAYPLHIVAGTPSGTSVGGGVNTLFTIEGDSDFGQGFAIVNNRASPSDVWTFATPGGGQTGFEMYSATYDIDAFGGDVDHSTLTGYFCVNLGGVIGWSNWGNPRYAIAAGIDTGLSRIADGVVGFGNGTQGDTSGTIAAKVTKLVPSTIAALPGTPAAGMLAAVSDGDAGLAWGAIAVNSGAGSHYYTVNYNGAAWTVIGK